MGPPRIVHLIGEGPDRGGHCRGRACKEMAFQEIFLRSEPLLGKKLYSLAGTVTVTGSTFPACPGRPAGGGSARALRRDGNIQRTLHSPFYRLGPGPKGSGQRQSGGVGIVYNSSRNHRVSGSGLNGRVAVPAVRERVSSRNGGWRWRWLNGTGEGRERRF